jgi:hypothetical protein
MKETLAGKLKLPNIYKKLKHLGLWGFWLRKKESTLHKGGYIYRGCLPPWLYKRSRRLHGPSNCKFLSFVLLDFFITATSQSQHNTYLNINTVAKEQHTAWLPLER